MIKRASYLFVSFIIVFNVLTGCDDDGPTDSSVTTGTLEVITATSGSDRDPDGYTIAVDGVSDRKADTSDTVIIPELEEGKHEVELTGVAANCSANGDNPQSISITAGETTSVSFQVSCKLRLLNKIVFQSERDGNNEIYVMDTNGGNPVNLTKHDASDRNPAVSPNGTKIAFNSTRRSGDLDIYVMNADGSNQRNLTRDPARDDQPDWAPNGEKIAFTSNREAKFISTEFDIYVMNADDGSNTKSLTPDAEAPAIDHDPTWSPNGKRIAFISNRDNPSSYKIYLMNADGSGVMPLTSNPPSGGDGYPAWSPDSDLGLIAFARRPDGSPEGKTDIFVIDTEGSRSPVNLTFGADGRDTNPCWSPIAFGDTKSF